MKKENAIDFFSELRGLAEEDLDDRLPEKIQDLKDLGIQLRVKKNLEEPEFIEDPSFYTEVIQCCCVWIGQKKSMNGKKPIGAAWAAWALAGGLSKGIHR